MFMPKLKKFPQGVPKTSGHENGTDGQPENIMPPAKAAVGAEA